MTMSGNPRNSTEKEDLKWTYFTMTNFCFISINGPLFILSLTANIFFAFCMTTCKTQRVKQPLKTLLGFVVSSTIIYSFFIPWIYGITLWMKSLEIIWTFLTIVYFIINVNMTSYVWLMFYYYIKIVPSQRALLVWVKMNIRSVIYTVLFVDRLVFFGYASWEMYRSVLVIRSSNGTYIPLVIHDIELAVTVLINLYIVLCLCIIMISCFATAHYINKHMKTLVASGGSVCNPQLRSQIRVTVTGILQGVLYFFYAMWFILMIFCDYLLPYVIFGARITFTVTSLYIAITTVNLGVGQTLFRERAVHVWKAVRKRLSTGKMPEDLRPAGYSLTDLTLATVEST